MDTTFYCQKHIYRHHCFMGTHNIMTRGHYSLTNKNRGQYFIDVDGVIFNGSQFSIEKGSLLL